MTCLTGEGCGVDFYDCINHSLTHKQVSGSEGGEQCPVVEPNEDNFNRRGCDGGRQRRRIICYIRYATHTSQRVSHCFRVNQAIDM